MFFVLDHPCVKAKLTILRDRETSQKQFRECVEEITCLVACEALKNLELVEIAIQTPICQTRGWRIKNDVVIVPILRAGLGMLEGVLRLVPNARVGFIGLERDHETALPHEYYRKLPTPTPDSMALVVDPMLATGGSLAATVDVLKKDGFRHIVVISVLASPEGRRFIAEAHPDVRVYTGGLDDRLNADKYIVPGLGDAGDRLFGTL